MGRMSVLLNGTRRERIWIERFGGLSRWWDSCPRKIGTGLSSFFFFSLLRGVRLKIKARSLLEPSLIFQIPP